MKPIALQMYTVRDLMAKDFWGTLQAVADIGFKGLEGGFGDKDPAEVARFLADRGVAVTSTHSPLPTKENIQQVVDTQKALGCDKVIGGFGPDDMKTVDACKACAEKFATAAELVKPYGMTYHFHNHYWEFHRVEDGRYPYEIFMEVPGLHSQLDLYWVAFGGASPVEILQKYGDRIQLLHVKDGLLGEKYHFKALGTGQVDLPAAIKAANPAVAEWLIVEQDMSDGDMMEDVKTGYKFLVSNGLGVGNK
ncbi:MAG: sugar phosphate isomerase/epimerase [Armatimonadetes bacterium]|nr:sugar phosphate isomerase/epimerase [Armatimonadota bacterium]